MKRSDNKEAFIVKAREIFTDDNIEVGTDPAVSKGDDGAWVQGWLFVPYDKPERYAVQLNFNGVVHIDAPSAETAERLAVALVTAKCGLIQNPDAINLIEDEPFIQSLSDAEIADFYDVISVSGGWSAGEVNQL